MLTLLSIAIAFLFLSGNKQPKKVATQKGSLKDIMYIAGTIGLLRALQYSIFNGDVSLELLYALLNILVILVRITIKRFFIFSAFTKKLNIERLNIL